jgi:hypothetical protein
MNSTTGAAHTAARLVRFRPCPPMRVRPCHGGPGDDLGGFAGAPRGRLDAIERMYEEAKACVAEATGWPAPDTTDPWPETESIDVRALKAPAAAGGRSGGASDTVSWRS